MRRRLTIYAAVFLLSSNTVAWASDIEPPKVTSWKLLNTVGDITNSSAKFQAELTVEDESEFDDPYLQLLPTNSTQFSDFASLEVISRTPKSKTYRATINIPITAITGIWKWSIRPLSDRNRNSTIGGSVFASGVDFSNNNSVEVVNSTSIAKAKAEAEAKAKAKAKAEAEAKAKAEAEAKAKAEAEAKAKAEAEAKAKAEAEAKAKAEAEAKVKAEAENKLREEYRNKCIKFNSDLDVALFGEKNASITFPNSSITFDAIIKIAPSGFDCSLISLATFDSELQGRQKLLTTFEIAVRDARVTAEANANKRITITCVKGKTTRKVSGLNPKCPKGFKRR